MTSVLVRGTEGSQPRKEDRDWSDAATSQGKPKTASNDWKVGRGKGRFFPGAFIGNMALTMP